MDHQAELIPVAERVDLRPIARLANERIVAWDAAVVVQAKNLSVGARGVLRLLHHAGRGRGHENLAIQREGQT